MDNIEILLNEYSNLWHEKIIHKESMRKLRGYVSYLTTIVSLSLTFMGMSTTDIFKNGLNNTVSPVFVKNFSDVFILISIPFTPIVLLIGSFALSDLFSHFRDCIPNWKYRAKNKFIVWRRSLKMGAFDLSYNLWRGT